MKYGDHVKNARAYYALCDEAESLGVPVSLDDPDSPATVADLEAAVTAARECVTG